MRRFFFALVVLASVPFGFAAPACSSNDASPSAADAGGDGGIPPARFQGEPCDPTLVKPCLPVPGCFTALCTEGADGVMTCGEVPNPGACAAPDSGIVLEAGVLDSAATISSCSSDLDCPTVPATDASLAVTYVCGFSAFEGCQAPGTCVFPNPPHVLDGAVQSACGCEGQSVPYVTDQRTSAPVKSADPCAPSAPVDGGIDGGDATTDAATDAPADASADAPDGD